MKRAIIATLLAGSLWGCTATQLQTAQTTATVLTTDATLIAQTINTLAPGTIKQNYLAWLNIAPTIPGELAALSANLNQYVATIKAATQPTK